MDPLSQAVAGSVFAGIFAKKNTFRPAILLGAIAGMAPDLDIIIRSSQDSLLALQYHRHFTHSIAFTPIGALLCATFFYLFPAFRRKLSFRATYAYCFLGYATHGIIDACTGYGTHLFWPFTANRESWNIIGIIDPLFTLPVLLLLLFGYTKQRQCTAIIALGWMLSYLTLGIIQQNRASEIMQQHLATNDINHERLTLRPTVGNLWLWRAIYEDVEQQKWQVKAVYLPYWKDEVRIYNGESVAIFYSSKAQAPTLNDLTAYDLERFAYFSDNYLSQQYMEDGTLLVGDVRYSMLPNGTQPLWGLALPNEVNQLSRGQFTRFPRTVDWQNITNMLQGKNTEKNELSR